MNCHRNNKNKECKKHNLIKHMLMMVLCCGLPLILIVMLPFINIGGGFKATIVGIAPFICPLMMLLMIPMMFKGMKHGNCCSRKKEIEK
ncbi:hypothetical protein [Clostridium uliginosum]|uniref:DUF2933 domain-containing protein n=1 Tax=Clostridium uliginosum TaxID=119641 RepID=A0A1I1JWD4_9CLOT|nr:hypothetical protein [Clostridium uliginosum]SFC50788.1 hypothetical protein SAMN05421842_104127 [Clostridium uliginosum]